MPGNGALDERVRLAHRVGKGTKLGTGNQIVERKAVLND